MRSLHIAWSLVRIPHLAFSLFLFPLIIGLVIVGIQSFLTAMAITMAARDSKTTETNLSQPQEESITRLLLFGDSIRRPDPIICRWVVDQNDIESAPSKECLPDRLDIAIRTKTPLTFDPERYVRLFAGNVDRIHLCETCKPDVVIDPEASRNGITHSYSVFGTLLALSPLWNPDLNKQQIRAVKERTQVKKTLGTHLLHLPETPDGIRLMDMGTALPIAMNITLFVLVALWLALKAHRKVLDYFARNDVLLPIVAACGQGPFYGALWILTGCRVVSFLVSGIVLVVLGFHEILAKGIGPLIAGGWSRGFLWLIALVTTLGLATLVASVAELKHRHSFMTSLLRYIPIAVALIGALSWSASLLIPGAAGSVLRTVISSVPVLGMVPVLVAPMIDMSTSILATHGTIALFACILIARSNSRWFAAHLDQL